MRHYMELSLLVSPEIPLHFLWFKTYQQLHLAFVEMKNAQNQIEIGVSFPEYGEKKRSLGSKLRVFSRDKLVLEQLGCQDKLVRLSDYLHVTKIREVPQEIKGHVSFKRVQTKSNNQRLARRKAKRHAMDYTQVIEEIASRKERYTLMPFIQVESLSNQNPFLLFIQKLEKEQPEKGLFSTYGLSATSTVPVF